MYYNPFFLNVLLLNMLCENSIVKLHNRKLIIMHNFIFTKKVPLRKGNKVETCNFHHKT